MPRKRKNLWKLDRRRRAASVPVDSDLGSAAAPTSPVGNSQTVGATLRRQREARDEDLRYVAQVLRIRYPYLKAIEDGLVDELPGPTYAVGFVRTYADHLGLDSDSMVSQFKAEVQGLSARADLHFPAPMPESKIPSGVVLIVAGLLALLVYGAWTYVSSKDEQVAEIVPQLPNRISEIIRGTASDSDAKNAEATQKAAGGETTETAPAAQATETAETKAAAAAPHVEKTEETQPAAQETAATTPSTPAPDGGERVADALAQDRVAGVSPTLQTPPPPVPAPPAAASPPSVTVEPPGTQQVASVSSGAATETRADAEDVSPAPRGSTVYGRDNSDARVVMQAVADSWVEIRDTDTNELLLTRVLFKGDSYQVPNRSGLTLLTGNAGGLKITVDGQPIPAIGPLGSVRRDIALDPDKLRSGIANATSDGPSTDSVDTQ